GIWANAHGEVGARCRYCSGVARCTGVAVGKGVILAGKWVEGLLCDDDGEAIKECYGKFIDMVQVYYETAKKPWYERRPKEDVVENISGNARVKDPQGKEKDDAGKEEALEEDMNIKTHFGVRLVGNMEEEAEQGSITDSNDFEDIV
nr:hypothetical protein [Tanacetum cinerariifolium]